MTTGSYSFGSKVGPANNWVGDYTTRTWNGTDRPSIPKGISRAEKNRLRAVPHPYTATIVRTVSPRIKVQGMMYSNGGWIPWGNPYDSTVMYEFGGPIPPTDPWTSNHELQLLSNLKDQVFGGSANMAVTLAEMKETLTSIASVATRVRKLLDHAVTFSSLPRRKRVAFAKGLIQLASRGRPIRTAGDYWLEWRYAVRPALLDLDSHCEMLANINNRPSSTRFRASAKAAASGTWRGGAGRTEHRARCVVEVTSKPNSLLVWSGATDPASVLWEKIPYSFVVDWVLPIGDFLSAVDLWRKVEGTFVTTHKVVRTVNGCYGSDGAKVVSGGGGFSYNQINLNRIVTSNPPIPYPSIDLSIRQTATALKRAIDAVSLFGLPRRL